MEEAIAGRVIAYARRVIAYAFTGIDTGEPTTVAGDIEVAAHYDGVKTEVLLAGEEWDGVLAFPEEQARLLANHILDLLDD